MSLTHIAAKTSIFSKFRVFFDGQNIEPLAGKGFYFSA
jgi:hypothetical protein